MSTTLIRRLGATGVATLATIALVSGCSGSKANTAADANNTATSASSGSTATGDAVDDSTPPDATPTKVVATGGGNFCKQVADSMNDEGLLSGTGDPTDLKGEVEQEEAIEAAVLKIAPKEIKGDLNTLFGALNEYFDAIKKADYDYTKIDPAVLTSISDPKVEAAEQRIDAYIQTTCGIDIGDDTTGGSSPVS